MPTPFVKTTSIPQRRIDGSGPRAQIFNGIDSLIPLGPHYRKNYYIIYVDHSDPDSAAAGVKEEVIIEKIEIDPKNILAVRVPQGVTMYPIPLLQQAIYLDSTSGDRLPLLSNSG